MSRHGCRLHPFTAETMKRMAGSRAPRNAKAKAPFRGAAPAACLQIRRDRGQPGQIAPVGRDLRRGRWPTGSPTATMTHGMDLVAFLSGEGGRSTGRDNHFGACASSSVASAGKRSLVSLGPAALNDDISGLHIPVPAAHTKRPDRDLPQLCRWSFPRNSTRRGCPAAARSGPARERPRRQHG